MSWYDMLFGGVVYLSIGGATIGAFSALDSSGYYHNPDNSDNVFAELLLWPVAFPMRALYYSTLMLKSLPETKRRRRLELEQLRHKNAMKELEAANRLLQD